VRLFYFVPLLWVAAIGLPYVLYELSKKLMRNRQQGWRRYETWKSEHFDESGRCRRHPSYDGLTWPEDPSCEACAAIHSARPGHIP
jgi:hypothetical protein